MSMSASFFVTSATEIRVERDRSIKEEINLHFDDGEGRCHIYFERPKDGIVKVKELADLLYDIINNEPREIHTAKGINQQLVHCPSCDQPLVFVQEPSQYMPREEKE